MGMTDVSVHGGETNTAEAKKIIDIECMIEEEGFFFFAATALSITESAQRSVYAPWRVLSPTGTYSQNCSSKTTGPRTI